MKKIFRHPWFWLFLILLLGLSLRLYKVDLPIADHHSWRQADTAAVARNYIKEGFDFLHPKIDNMAPVSKEVLPNPQRYFFAEPPIYQVFVAGVYSFFGVEERLARLVSIGFSLGAIVFLYFLTNKLVNQWVGLLASFFMAILPFSVYFSRVVMPEAEMLFASLGMFFFFLLWLEKQNKPRFVFALLFTAWALTIKTFPFFLALPMFYLAWRKWGISLFKEKSLYFFVGIAVLPILAWRLWISQFPEGIPSYPWLFNLYGIRFRPAFFRWIFAERIGKLIMGYWGLPLFVLGLILKPPKKEGWFFHWWLFAFLVFVTVFASGNVTHDYYQVPFIPLAAVFLAKGSYWLLKTSKRELSRLTSFLLLITCVLFMFGFSWYEIKGFYHIKSGVDLAGVAVDELTPQDALVLTGDSNDVSLLYNTNRQGWTGGYASYFPNEAGSLDKARKLGAEFYVTTKVNELKGTGFGQFLYQEFKLIKETDQYVIFDIR